VITHRGTGRGQVGACNSGRKPWKRINTLYSDIQKNDFFSRNLGQNMLLKMRIF